VELDELAELGDQRALRSLQDPSEVVHIEGIESSHNRQPPDDLGDKPELFEVFWLHLAQQSIGCRLSVFSQLKPESTHAMRAPTIKLKSFRHPWISETLMAGVDVLLVARIAGMSVVMIERVCGQFGNPSCQEVQAREVRRPMSQHSVVGLHDLHFHFANPNRVSWTISKFDRVFRDMPNKRVDVIADGMDVEGRGECASDKIRSRRLDLGEWNQ
jgi:hypothetical protein